MVGEDFYLVTFTSELYPGWPISRQESRRMRSLDLPWYSYGPCREERKTPGTGKTARLSGTGAL